MSIQDVLDGRRSWTIEESDVRAGLALIPDGVVAATVTSPPYWRQRDYGHPLQLGWDEPAPECYVARMVPVFAEVRRVLTATGSLWLNVGDKYAAGGMGGGRMASGRKNWAGTMGQKSYRNPPPGYKPKDLTLVAFQLADALRRDGWYLRQTIIWSKSAAVEPPRRDRPSTAHEYLFQLTKGEVSTVRNPGEPWFLHTVWQISHDSDGSHSAAMPCELARRCIVSSTQEGDLVLDPFCGSGTSGVVAMRLNRRFIGLELNPDYCEMAQQRILDDAPLLNAQLIPNHESERGPSVSQVIGDAPLFNTPAAHP